MYANTFTKYRVYVHSPGKWVHKSGGISSQGVQAIGILVHQRENTPAYMLCRISYSL